jgi:hypothetical protein
LAEGEDLPTNSLCVVGWVAAKKQVVGDDLLLISDGGDGNRPNPGALDRRLFVGAMSRVHRSTWLRMLGSVILSSAASITAEQYAA